MSCSPINDHSLNVGLAKVGIVKLGLGSSSSVLCLSEEFCMVQFSGSYVWAEPETLCRPHKDPERYRGRIVIALRGSCYYEEKAVIASSTGALALVVLSK